MLRKVEERQRDGEENGEGNDEGREKEGNGIYRG